MKKLNPQTIIHDPLLMALTVQWIPETQAYQIIVTPAPDPEFKSVRIWAQLLSDSIDHISDLYSEELGAPSKNVKRTLMKYLVRENKMKEKDPNYANDQTGITLKGNQAIKH